MTLKEIKSLDNKSSFEKARGYKLDKQPLRGKATTRTKDSKTGKINKFKYPKSFSSLKKGNMIANVKTGEQLEVYESGMYHVIGKTKDGRRQMFLNPEDIKKVQ